MQVARDLPQGSLEERLQRDRALLQVREENLPRVHIPAVSLFSPTHVLSLFLSLPPSPFLSLSLFPLSLSPSLSFTFSIYLSLSFSLSIAPLSLYLSPSLSLSLSQPPSLFLSLLPSLPLSFSGKQCVCVGNGSGCRDCDGRLCGVNQRRPRRPWLPVGRAVPEPGGCWGGPGRGEGWQVRDDPPK